MAHVSPVVPDCTPMILPDMAVLMRRDRCRRVGELTLDDRSTGWSRCRDRRRGSPACARRDGHARDDDVELATGVELRDQRVELLAGEVHRQAELLGDSLAQVDVEALGDSTVHRLERRERRIGADGQHAFFGQLRCAFPLGLCGGLRPGAATASECHNAATMARASSTAVILRAFCIVPPRRFRHDPAQGLKSERSR